MSELVDDGVLGFGSDGTGDWNIDVDTTTSVAVGHEKVE